MSGDNRMTQCLLSCLSCIVACFERFVEFLNRNAYIQIALTGKSFCPAAKDAFESIWSNATRYSLVSGMGEIFTFVYSLINFLNRLENYSLVCRQLYLLMKYSSMSTLTKQGFHHLSYHQLYQLSYIL